MESYLTPYLIPLLPYSAPTLLRSYPTQPLTLLNPYPTPPLPYSAPTLLLPYPTPPLPYSSPTLLHPYPLHPPPHHLDSNNRWPVFRFILRMHNICTEGSMCFTRTSRHCQTMHVVLFVLQLVGHGAVRTPL